jgi:hypothetical protein
MTAISTHKTREVAPRIRVTETMWPGWVQLNVTDLNGAWYHTAVIPTDEVSQEVAVAAARFTRLHAEQAVRESHG